MPQDSEYQDLESQDLAHQDLKASWTQHPVTVELYAFYREETNDWDNTAWLNIHYSPNLDAYYTSPYQQQLTLHAEISYMCVPFQFDLNVDYRQVHHAIYTPDCFKALLSPTTGLVWCDAQAGIIGFASVTFSQVYASEAFDILQLAVQNFRGSEGRHALEIIGNNSVTVIGGVSDTAKFIESCEQIAKLINKKVTHYTYDEHY